ncbi:hypothetical protein BGX26_012850, partial [Mortierella sp. AD094]
HFCFASAAALISTLATTTTTQGAPVSHDTRYSDPEGSTARDGRGGYGGYGGYGGSGDNNGGSGGRDGSSDSGAHYSIKNLNNGDEIRSGTTSETSPSSMPPPRKSDTLSCQSPSRSGSDFSVNCDSRSWFVWVECSDGNRYTTRMITEDLRVTMTCPDGITASDGGVYDS